jgi:hypothetical protein
MSRVRLRDEHKELLAQLYNRTHKTLDDLPYTEEFERLHASFLNRTGLNLSRHDVWRAIVSARKSGRLARKQRPLLPPDADAVDGEGEG